jgi:cellulose synthase operon protein C
MQADEVSPLEQARVLLQTGGYEQACEAYEALADDDQQPADVRRAAALGLSRAWQQRGLWDAAAQVIKAALERTPEAADLLARRGELQFLRGEYDAAEASVKAALAIDREQLLARLMAAHLAGERGEFDEALEGYRWFVRYYNRVQPTDADSLLLVGQGSLQYARWKSVSAIYDFVVNTLAVDALADDEHCWQASLLAGDLLLEKYNKPQAEAELSAALMVNPRAAEVIVAQGRAALVDHELEKAIELAGKALKINPALPEALLLAADVSITTGELKSAMEFITPARKINPRDQRTLARLAGVLLLDDGVPTRGELEALLDTDPDRQPAAVHPNESSRFEKIWQIVLKDHPRPGVFLTDVGDILDGHRKYEAAEVFYRRAIDVMPQLSAPRTALGMLAMRTGDLEQAESILDAAFKADPYHVRVSNMRKVLRQLREYETVTSEHFVVRVPQDDRLLGEAMAEYLEETYDELTALFGFEPEQRTQFEVFGPGGGNSAHQWFSARMVGLPWVQTVGASTGMIVALASPHESSPPFNWARVVRHEFVHILTLQQTRFNIPHWYTEALAVRTEGVTPAEWDTLLLRRVPAGEVFSLKDINAGFQRPEGPDDWQMAYCQSWLYANYIAETFGEEAHAKLLEAYHDNLSTEAAIERACGVGLEAFEAGYTQYVNAYIETIRGKRIEQPPSIEAAQKRWRENPIDRKAQEQLSWAMWNGDRKREALGIARKLLEDDPDRLLAVAIVADSLLDDSKLDAAEELLRGRYDPADPQPELLERLARVHAARGDWEQAKAFWQTAADRWPRELRLLKSLAAALLRQGDESALRGVLERLAGLDADDLLSRKKLATMARAAEDWTAAIRWASEALHIDINDASMHRVLAEAYEATGDAEAAGRQRAVLSRMENGR